MKINSVFKVQYQCHNRSSKNIQTLSIRNIMRIEGAELSTETNNSRKDGFLISPIFFLIENGSLKFLLICHFETFKVIWFTVLTHYYLGIDLELKSVEQA